MKSRLLASVAVGAAVALGLTGCTFITPQSTAVEYSAGDGVNVEGSAPLEVRNVIVVANPEGTAGNLIAAIVNPPTNRKASYQVCEDLRAEADEWALTTETTSGSWWPDFLAWLAARSGHGVDRGGGGGAAAGVRGRDAGMHRLSADANAEAGDIITNRCRFSEAGPP